MKKSIFVFLILAFTNNLIFSYDWPQKNVNSDSFYSFFGQLRGNTISNSLIFTESEEIYTSEKGEIVSVITEHGNDFGWFESTLGNCVIVSHEDKLATIYGNLEEDSIPKELFDVDKIDKNIKIGESSNSGWQDGLSCLEFQVIDTKNLNTINPRVLMPRLAKDIPLNIKNLKLINRQDKVYDLNNTRKVPTGIYKLYKERQRIAVPYKTTITINGIAHESFSYDTLQVSNGKLCVKGNKFYPLESLYPSENQQLLSELKLTKGTTSINISIQNILGAKINSSIILEVY